MHYVKTLGQYVVSKEFLIILLEVCGLKQMLEQSYLNKK